MNINDYIKNYLTSKGQKSHGFFVRDFSLILFDKLKMHFPQILEKYNNKNDIKLLEYSALLHDIGGSLEKSFDKPHHKIGRDMILKNGIEKLDENEALIVANIVRYHRKSIPDENNHWHFRKLNEDDRQKVKVFASIVRLVDSFDYSHLGFMDNIEIEYDKKLNILTLDLCINIMLNKGLEKVLDEKKKLFEKTFNTTVSFC